MSTVGRSLLEGCLTPEEAGRVATDGLDRLPLDGLRVLVLIPDGTRTMPMPLMFETLERALGPRVAALDYLVALGTHMPMSDGQLTSHLGRTVVDGRAGDRRIFNHRWDGDLLMLRESGHHHLPGESCVHLERLYVGVARGRQRRKYGGC